MDYNTFYFSR